LWFIACKVAPATIKCCVLTYGGIFLSPGMEKGVKYNQDQSSIMLLLEYNFSHNVVALRVTLKCIMLNFFSKMYLGLLRTRKASLEAFISRVNHEIRYFVQDIGIMKYTF